MNSYDFHNSGSRLTAHPQIHLQIVSNYAFYHTLSRRSFIDLNIPSSTSWIKLNSLLVSYATAFFPSCHSALTSFLSCKQRLSWLLSYRKVNSDTRGWFPFAGKFIICQRRHVCGSDTKARRKTWIFMRFWRVLPKEHVIIKRGSRIYLFNDTETTIFTNVFLISMIDSSRLSHQLESAVLE